MSDKKRRDITLGEMQDECKKHTQSSCACKTCPYYSWCGAGSPDSWDLTDPPRFTEAQMALLKGLQSMGARYIERHDIRHTTVADDKCATMLIIEKYHALGDFLNPNEVIDLAELLGKDGT